MRVYITTHTNRGSTQPDKLISMTGKTEIKIVNRRNKTINLKSRYKKNEVSWKKKKKK